LSDAKFRATASSERRLLRAAAAGPLLLLLAFTVLAGPGCSSACARPSDSRFDRVQSDADAQKYVGWSRDEVVSAFGETAGASRLPGEWEVTYWMRPRGFCMDGWYLALDFGSDDRVSRAGVRPG